jgi:hypothetical protein
MIFFKKIFAISFANGLNSVLGFLTTFLIVRFISVDVLGEYTVFLSMIGLISIVFSIIPPNYSVIKFQEDVFFKNILFLNYIIVSILILLALIVFDLFIKIDVLKVFVFVVSTGFLNYIDIYSQAKSKLKSYYYFLLFISFLKLLVILYMIHFHLLSFKLLLYYFTIVHLCIIFIICFFKRKNIISFLIKPSLIIDLLKFLITNFISFKAYYFNSIIKRFRTTSIVLVFDLFVPKSTIGLFSLFVKVLSFSNGLFRIIEAFFMNKLNQTNHKKLFKSKFHLIGGALFVINFLTGLVYLKINIDQFYFIENIILSTLSFSYIKFIYTRSELLIGYQNKTLNYSELIFIVVLFTMSGFMCYFNLTGLIYLVLSYYISTLILQLYVINKKNIIKV